jgi:ribose/xylose/arabinose/galactoside ABC-type transport system permease subunit
LISALSASALVEAPGVAALPFAGGLGACCALGGLVQMRKLPAIIVTLGASFIWSGIAYTLQPTRRIETAVVDGRDRLVESQCRDVARRSSAHRVRRFRD